MALGTARRKLGQKQSEWTAGEMSEDGSNKYLVFNILHYSEQKQSGLVD